MTSNYGFSPYFSFLPSWKEQSGRFRPPWHLCGYLCVTKSLSLHQTDFPENSCHSLHHCRTSQRCILSSSLSCSWRLRCVSCSLILKMKLVPPSLPRSSYVPFVLLVYIVVLVLVVYLCPSSVRDVATFPGIDLFPLLCSVLPFFS